MARFRAGNVRDSFFFLKNLSISPGVYKPIVRFQVHKILKAVQRCCAAFFESKKTFMGIRSYVLRNY